MSRVRVQSFSVSLDGFGAGPAQDLEHPLGVGGEGLFGWAHTTRTFRRSKSCRVRRRYGSRRN